jgi:hypothetical protein
MSSTKKNKSQISSLIHKNLSTLKLLHFQYYNLQLKLPCRAHVTVVVNEHSDQFQYLTQHIVGNSDILLIIKLENIRGRIKASNCSRHPNGREYT